MTAFTVRVTTVTTYAVDIDLPASVQEYVDAGLLLTDIDTDASDDLSNALVSADDGRRGTVEITDIAITETDLPGHRLSLPFSL